MTAQRKSEILKILDGEITARKAQLTKAESSRKERVEETIASWSAAGDRAHAENALDLARASVAQLEALRDEVLHTNDIAAERVEPVCFVTLQDDSAGTTKNFYLASESVKLPGITVLGTKSPLGQAISGKKVGDKYSYKIDAAEYFGKIISIE